MKNRLIALVKKTFRPKDKDFRNHLYIFLICVVISLFIWFLIKMSDEYVAEVNMPVNYGNLPARRSLVKADDHVQVRLRAKGSDIFSVLFLSGRKQLTVNLHQAEIKKNKHFDSYYLLSDNLEATVSEKLGVEHIILSITPDTLFFDFDDIAAKTVPIVSKVTFSCKTQYQAYDSLAISPREITVTGPASMIDTLGHINTASANFKDLDKSLEAKVLLDLPFSGEKVQYSDREVNVFVPIEKYTESTIDLPIKCISGEAGTIMRTYPETAQLTYSVALKDFTSVRSDMFLLTATYDPVRDKDKNFIKVNLSQAPEFIRVTRIQPDKVEFLIQKQ